MSPKRLSYQAYQERKLKRLEDPEVNRWYHNVARGSLITADAYLRALFLFAERMKTDPNAILKLKERALHGLLLDFVTAEETRGAAGHSTLNYTKAVQSWLAHNGIKLNQAIKVRRAYDTPTIRDERIPGQEELKRIFLACQVKDRVSAVLMAHSGVRPEVIGNYLGVDGLRVRDFPEMKIKNGSVSFEQMPTMVVVRPELSKAGHRYFTFLGSEGCSYLVDYLTSRIQEGETLTPDTDIVHPKWRDKAFLRSINVSDGIRLGIRATMGREVKMRPYALRAYFDTQLLLAESKGKVAHDYRVFWMGHRGSMESRYTTNKGRLPQHFIEDMRQAYNRCEPFLGTTPGQDAGQVDAAVNRQFLRLAGYTDEEIAEIDVSDVEKVRDFARERLTMKSEETPKTLPLSPPAGTYQIVVEPNAVANLIAHGWTMVDKLTPEQVVMVSPSTPGTSPTPSSSRPAPRATSGPAPLSAPTAKDGGAGASAPPASDPADRLPQRTLPKRSQSQWEENASRQPAAAPPDGPTGSVR